MCAGVEEKKFNSKISTSGQDGENDLPSYPKQPEKLHRKHGTMIFQTLNLTQQRVVSLSNGKQAR